ncbi:MAG: hypothetical protein ACE5FL_00070 [Myxococcota bacterium]
MFQLRSCQGFVIAAAVGIMIWVPSAAASGPGHPIVTEVFQDPLGNDGPVGRDPGNPHQEYIEIYLPALSDLAAGLDKDALNLTFYEIEGDSSSSGIGQVNYRIDLPTFDLDPGNGTVGLPRPPSGVVVLGWVDYLGNPPVDLAGTPSSRVALVNGGITSATDFTFIAINGGQFSGTTNFPVPDAISHLDLTFNPTGGKIEQGSAAYLLVNRDSPGYAQLCDQNDPAPCNSFADLPSGTTLGTASLLDGFAGNDHGKFDPLAQPYLPPTGDNIDLEFVLPLGGAFSLLVPQLQELQQGYARLYLDSIKTTEDGIPGNENPAADALSVYRSIADLGPLGPTPGRAPSTTSAAELELAQPAMQLFDVLRGTTGRPGVRASNIGGDFGMDAWTTPGASSDPLSLTLGGGDVSTVPTGQMLTYPPVVVTALPAAAVGHMEVVAVQVDAARQLVSDPPAVNPIDVTTASYRVIDPVTGLDALGLPLQATSFVAVQGLPDEVGVPNEFAATSLAQFIGLNLGGAVVDDRGNGLALIDPTTDLTNPLIVEPMIATIPTDPALFINAAGPLGKPDLVATILGSAEIASGADTYADSFDATSSAVQARQFTLPATATSGGIFVPNLPSERIHYTDPKGFVGAPDSGFTDAETTRGFELALVDTNLGPTGFVETGATDDFGLVVQVGRTRVGSPVETGEFVFLSLMGGLQGADVDTLDVPPHSNLTDIVYVDLDPLDSQLDVETITGLFVIDGSGGGEADFIEVFSLAVDGVIPVPEPSGIALIASGILGLGVLNALRGQSRRG